MLYQRTCCVILPRRIVVGRQFLGGLDFFVFVWGGVFFFFLRSTQTEVCCTEISVLQQHASNTKHFFFPFFFFFLFSASLPVGKIAGSFPAVQSEGNLIRSEFSSL